jgi:ABC-type nitrate/sulfonate/bicarbonate transport system substrate-binding protein
MKRRLWAIGACVALALTTFASSADADTKLRVGKAQAQQFAFVPVHVGVETGIFKKHGLDIEISNFGGDAKLLQALAADAIDIALGGGPTIAFVQKGTPMLGIAALVRRDEDAAGGARHEQAFYGSVLAEVGTEVTVGWAKRSVPTMVEPIDAWARRVPRLCPPYEETERRGKPCEQF